LDEAPVRNGARADTHMVKPEAALTAPGCLAISCDAHLWLVGCVYQR